LRGLSGSQSAAATLTTAPAPFTVEPRLIEHRRFTDRPKPRPRVY